VREVREGSASQKAHLLSALPAEDIFLRRAPYETTQEVAALEPPP
jgi:hypothetical protein